MKSISATNLSKSYGDLVAVNGIDIQVEAGHAFGFLGSNGAGKSTTIKMLTTLIQPTRGKLDILGIDALRNPLKVRDRIGVVLQQPSYEPTLSVEKSLTKYGMMWNMSSDERQRRAEQLLHDFELTNLKKRRNEDLSIGQRRRVQVAREFMHDMDLLFLDEPTVGLDPAARRSLLDYLKEKVRGGLTIFYTTHVLSEADYLCDEIAIIKEGEILVSDTPSSIKKKMRRKKIITLRTNVNDTTAREVLTGINDCTVESGMGAHVVIESTEPEETLLRVLSRLHQNNIKMREISAEAATLEDIFLETVGNAPHNSTD
ncbi:MAG: ABC transporter ATP-binding protein [Cenarchaeum sp. SB0675_bin_21]|nr:ABC transporter ATP-binding protein [Cenarchaeum sp. SB0675_bin_21]